MNYHRILPLLLVSMYLFAKPTTNNMVSLKTTISEDGIVSSFSRKNDNVIRIISTLYHPKGCYQIAIFDKPFGDKMLGYKLASTQKDAISMHVAVLNELSQSDPENWSSWTTNRTTAITIMKNSEAAPTVWDVKYLDLCLSKYNLPKTLK